MIARLGGMLVLVAAGAPGAEPLEPPLPGASSPPPSISVALRAGVVTLEVRNAPLADVLRAIAAGAGFELRLHGDVVTPITRAFEDVPLERAIERLARGHSLGFVYVPGAEGSPDTLAELWVIDSVPPPRPAPLVAAREGRHRLGPVRSRGVQSAGASLEELAGTLAHDPDPSVRTRAAFTLGRVRQPAAAPALRTGLDDADPSVRIHSIRALARIEREQAADAIGRLLLGDPEASVRRAAALTLVSLSSEAARSALEAATADADEFVRRTATSALAHWEHRFR